MVVSDVDEADRWRIGTCEWGIGMVDERLRQVEGPSQLPSSWMTCADDGWKGVEGVETEEQGVCILIFHPVIRSNHQNSSIRQACAVTWAKHLSIDPAIEMTFVNQNQKIFKATYIWQ